MTRRFCILFCISILMTGIFCNMVIANVPHKTLRWTERLLTKANQPISRHGGEFTQGWDVMNAKDAYIYAIRKYGGDKRLYAGLADSQVLLGEYSEAIRNYQSALKLSPHDKSLKNRLILANQSDYISKLAIGSLPESHQVIRALRYLDGKNSVWLVISAIIKKHSSNGYNDIKLTVFSVRQNKLYKLWQSEELCYSKPNLTEADRTQLILKDITGDNKPEIIVPTSFVGGSWIPSYLGVFRWQNGKMHQLLGVRSDEPLTLSDFNNDGSFEVSNEYCIGSYMMSHAEMPRWKDIYAYKNGTFQLADGDYPKQYRELAREIRQKLRTYPNDWSLFKYQGIIYQFQHNRSRALCSFKRALRKCKASLKNETDKEYKSYLVNNIKDIEHRINSIHTRKH